MVNEQDEPARVIRVDSTIDQNRIFNVPGVVLFIAGLCVAIFFIMGFIPRRFYWAIEVAAAVTPREIMAGVNPQIGFLGYISPLFAHMFVHGNLMHLTFNTVSLLAFGSPVARRMGAENALQSISALASAGLYLSFYLLCGAFGALAFVFMHPSDNALLIGASGGVSGLLGAVVRFIVGRPSLMGREFGQIAPLMSKPVLIWTGFIVLMNVFFGTIGAGIVGEDNIAWEAHIGGFLFGLITYPLFERLAKSWHSR